MNPGMRLVSFLVVFHSLSCACYPSRVLGGWAHVDPHMCVLSIKASHAQLSVCRILHGGVRPSLGCFAGVGECDAAGNPSFVVSYAALHRVLPKAEILFPLPASILPGLQR